MKKRNARVFILRHLRLNLLLNIHNKDRKSAQNKSIPILRPGEKKINQKFGKQKKITYVVGGKKNVYVKSSYQLYAPEERKDLHLSMGIPESYSILPPFILHVLLTIEDFRTWPLFAIPEPRNISMILNIFDVLHAT